VPCVESVVQFVSCCSLIWIRVVCQGHVLRDAAGTPSNFDMQITLSRACDCPVLLHVAVTHQSLASCRAVCLLRPPPDVVDW